MMVVRVDKQHGLSGWTQTGVEPKETQKYREYEAQHTISTHPTLHEAMTLGTTVLSMRERWSLSRLSRLLFKMRLLLSIGASARLARLTPRRPSAAWQVMVDVPRRAVATADTEKAFIILIAFRADYCWFSVVVVAIAVAVAIVVWHFCCGLCSRFCQIFDGLCWESAVGCVVVSHHPSQPRHAQRPR